MCVECCLGSRETKTRLRRTSEERFPLGKIWVERGGKRHARARALKRSRPEAAFPRSLRSARALRGSSQSQSDAPQPGFAGPKKVVACARFPPPLAPRCLRNDRAPVVPRGSFCHNHEPVIHLSSSKDALCQAKRPGKGLGSTAGARATPSGHLME